MLLTKRRQVLAAMAVGGLTAASAASMADMQEPPQDVGIGGGDMADALSHREARVYWWDDEDLPDAGVKGRYLDLLEDAGEFSAGDLLFDDGEEWILLDRGFNEIRSQSHTTGQASITDSLDATNLNQGTPSEPSEGYAYGEGGSHANIGASTATTVDGDNSATNLFGMHFRDGLEPTSGLLVVMGRQQGATTIQFTDSVWVSRIIVGSQTSEAERDSPGARSYSRDGVDIQIAIDDANETYDVVAVLIGGMAG